MLRDVARGPAQALRGVARVFGKFFSVGAPRLGWSSSKATVFLHFSPWQSPKSLSPTRAARSGATPMTAMARRTRPSATAASVPSSPLARRCVGRAVVPMVVPAPAPSETTPRKWWREHRRHRHRRRHRRRPRRRHRRRHRRHGQIQSAEIHRSQTNSRLHRQRESPTSSQHKKRRLVTPQVCLLLPSVTQLADRQTRRTTMPGCDARKNYNGQRSTEVGTMWGGVQARNKQETPDFFSGRFGWFLVDLKPNMANFSPTV